MVKITFITSADTELQIEASSGTSLMHAAVQNDIEGILGECGGACSCATCHVYLDGVWGSKCGSPSAAESDMLEFVSGLDESSRLACQISLTDEMDGLVVRLPKSQY